MAQQRSNGEIHRADPGYRRIMMVVLALTAIVGIGGVVALHLWLTKQGASLSAVDLAGFERSLHKAVAYICLVLAVPGAAFAAWLFRIAAATRAERRWPPSHMRTSADVRIRYLTSADSLVTQMRAGAVAVTIVTLGLLAWAAWMFRTL